MNFFFSLNNYFSLNQFVVGVGLYTENSCVSEQAILDIIFSEHYHVLYSQIGYFFFRLCDKAQVK